MEANKQILIPLDSTKSPPPVISLLNVVLHFCSYVRTKKYVAKGIEPKSSRVGSNHTNQSNKKITIVGTEQTI